MTRRRAAAAAAMALTLWLIGPAAADGDSGDAAADGDSGRAARQAAQQYLQQGNPLWAERTLLQRLVDEPADLETRTWAIWLALQQADLDRAAFLLEGASEPEPGPLEARLELLQIVLARQRDPGADLHDELRAVGRDGDGVFREDLGLYRELRTQLTGNPRDPVTIRLNAGGGYTSNATQSAPQDVGSDLDAAGSALGTLDAVVRFEPWVSTWMRPVGEARVKLFGPLAESSRGFGSLTIGGRAGGEVGRHDAARLRLLYSYEQLLIGDLGWYMQAHRGELEFDTAPWLQLFGGVGRRIYAHLPRTRTEVDGGAAVAVPMGRGWDLTGIVSGRVQQARNEAFHDRGLTGLMRLRIPLPRDVMIKLRLMVLLDVYPESAAYYYGDRDRRDVMVKVEAGPWTPSWGGLRLGLTYDLSHRTSTIDTPTDSFGYTDHRVQLQLRWQHTLDATLPLRHTGDRDHIALPYGLDETGDLGLDRVQDLLRQQDSATRGSQCVD